MILCHTIAWYFVILPILNTTTLVQVVVIEDTENTARQLLQHFAMYSDPILRLLKSDTILQYHSDASYPSISKGFSKATRYFYLSLALTTVVNNAKPTIKSKPTTSMESMFPLNVDIHVLYTIITNADFHQ